MTLEQQVHSNDVKQRTTERVVKLLEKMLYELQNEVAALRASHINEVNLLKERILNLEPPNEGSKYY